MKRKLPVIIVLSVIIGFIVFLLLRPKSVWERNAEAFSNSFNMISGNMAIIDDLSGFTTFKWDTLFSFSPYVPEETIYKAVGYKWDNINSTVSEGMNQVVFLDKGKVVCYIYGYPDRYKVFFNFGQYEGDYFKLTSNDRLAFKMTVTDDGIRWFDYIKQ